MDGLLVLAFIILILISGKAYVKGKRTTAKWKKEAWESTRGRNAP